MHIPVMDNASLVRDSDSKAILSTDVIALQEHRKKKRLFESMISDNKNLNQRVQSLENDIADIKTMMTTMISFLKDK